MPACSRPPAALAIYDPESPGGRPSAARWLRRWCRSIPSFSALVEALRPVRDKLTAPLAAIFRDKERPETEHTLATNILADYASDDPDLLADLLMDADPKAYATFSRRRTAEQKTSCPLFQAEIERKAIPKPARSRRGQGPTGRAAGPGGGGPGPPGQGRAGLAPLAAQRRPPAPQLHRQLARAPGSRSRGSLPSNSTDRPQGQADARRGQQTMDAILFHPETSMRRALILALGTYGTEGCPPASESR